MNKKPFVKNGISFTEFTMSYEKIEIDLTGIYSFKKLLEQERIDNIADFNTILDNALKSVGLFFVDSDPPYDMRLNTDSYFLHEDKFTLSTKNNISFKIDGKKITLSSDTTNKNITRYKINDVRINKFEIPECLTHILCHQTLESYEKFLKSVSSCSLKFHKAIAQNVKKSISYSSDDGIIELKISRKKNRNYLTVGKKDFSINNTNRLIDSSVNNMTHMVEMILSTVNIGIKDIKPLLSEGQKRYLEAMKKSKLLLDTTLKRFDAKTETHDEKHGYVITGKSGTRYLIEDNINNSFKTWVINPNGGLDYRCIVDKTHKGQVGKDALVSRLFALANDVLIAKDVYTLQRDVR